MQRGILFGIILSLLVFQPQNAAAKNPKVTICHKGHTITIAESAVNAHLAHGDSEGECTEEQQAEKEQGEYQYLYFLSSQVYYDEKRALYFFQSDGEWQEAAELPATITVNQQEMVSVSLDVDLPYIEHESILKRYPVPQAAAVEYRYQYYPAAQVYYDESRKLYFYMVNAEWQQAETLPSTITLSTQEGVSITLDLDLPYLKHDMIVEQYPAVEGEYHYLYYPSAQVYYDETRTLYFYQLERQWQQAERLPESIEIVATEAVSLILKTATPYLQHENILHLYPTATSTPLESEDNEQEKPQKKVTICHKGKNTLSIAESALQAHLDHGDTMGACESQQQQEDSEQKANGTKEKPKKSEKQEKGKGKNK